MASKVVDSLLMHLAGGPLLHKLGLGLLQGSSDVCEPCALVVLIILRQAALLHVRHRQLCRIACSIYLVIVVVSRRRPLPHLGQLYAPWRGYGRLAACTGAGSGQSSSSIEGKTTLLYSWPSRAARRRTGHLHGAPELAPRQARVAARQRRLGCLRMTAPRIVRRHQTPVCPQL